MMRTLTLAILAGLALSIVSCKTNERNMFDAYDKAMAGKAALQDQDVPYNAVRKEMNHEDVVVGGDTLDLSSQWVRATENGGCTKDNLRRYCVVVGQFKQRFNAMSMRERLMQNGYPECFVVETREPYYFVVADSYNEIDDAVALLRKVGGDDIFRFKAPLPFILRPAQIR